MSKFLNRISDIISKKDIAVVVGKDFPYLGEVVESFNSVFVYDAERPDIKARNLIPRIDFTDVKTLPSVDLLIIEEKYLIEIGNFSSIASRYRAGIILMYSEQPSKKILKHLWQHNYELADTNKAMNLWKKTKV